MVQAARSCTLKEQSQENTTAIFKFERFWNLEEQSATRAK